MSLYSAAAARAIAAAADGDKIGATVWWERAWRLSGRHLVPGLHLASLLLQHDDERAVDLLRAHPRSDRAFPVAVPLAAALVRLERIAEASRVMTTLLRETCLPATEPLAPLAAGLAHAAGRVGWIGWCNDRVVLGAATQTEFAPDGITLRVGRNEIVAEWRRDGDRVWSAGVPSGAMAADIVPSHALFGGKLRMAAIRSLEGRVRVSDGALVIEAEHPNDPARRPVIRIATHSPAGTTAREVALEEGPPPPDLPLSASWRAVVPLAGDAVAVSVSCAITLRVLAGSPIDLTRDTEVPDRPQATPHVAAIASTLSPGAAPTLLVTHDEGGGIERHVATRMAALARLGTAVAVLRSTYAEPDLVSLGGAAGAAGMAFRLPADWDALLGTVRQWGVARIEIHHLRKHPPVVAGLPAALGVPYDVVLHDYALVCPRVTMVGENGRYCGEPAIAACERCAAAFAREKEAVYVPVATMRQQARALLDGAGRVIAPSADTAARFARLVVGASVTVRPWETRSRASGRSPPPTVKDVTVCVIGGLGAAKGLDVLIACAREARVLGRPMRFVVVGHTTDDDALIDAGAFVTGPYSEGERRELVARQGAHVGFMPSIWPETWCYALSGLFEAGLPTLCFDLGAQAERVRRAGGVVLPLDASPSIINQRLLELSASGNCRAHANSAA